MSGLHYAALQRVPKTRTRSAPMPSRVPAPRQPIPGITLGLCFLGHPSHQGIRLGRLLPSLREPLMGLRSVRSVCPFSVTLGRHCTPRPSYRVNTTYANTTWPNGDVSPFGPACYSRFAGSISRRLRAFVENPDHSHPFEASPLSASSLSPFCPCTPTFDSQSLAVGQHSLPSTWG